jgi:hypothetical protein
MFLPSSASVFYIQYQDARTEVTTPAESAIPELTWQEKKTVTSSFSVTDEFITFTSRVILSRFKKNNYTSAGYTFAEDLDIKTRILTFSGRIAIFQSDYDNRHYLYEKDLLYNFYVPAYFGKGARTVLNFRLKIRRKGSLNLKYSRTTYFTPPNTEQALPKEEIKIQLLWKI